MIHANWRGNLRLAGGISAALTAIVSFAVALPSYSNYLPATRGYTQEAAKQEGDSILAITTARLALLQNTIDQARLQINESRRAGLRSDKFERERQLAAATDPVARELLTKRLQEIGDELAEVDAERARLKLP